MKLLFSKTVIGWVAASLAVVTPPNNPDVAVNMMSRTPFIQQPQQQQQSSISMMQEGVTVWLAATAEPPSNQDIELLQAAFAEFYGVNRDLVKSEALLSQVVTKWQGQPADELAGIYRVRGDCYMAQQDAAKAAADYGKAVTLLKSPAGSAADPEELPAALLGRARASKSLAAAGSNDKANAAQAATDYEEALKLSSREDWDTDQELLEDGATRNPYAAWEFGDALRLSGKYGQAATAHSLASSAFDQIGDRARSVISLLDAGIDLACADQVADAESVLRKGIQKVAGVEGRDVALLQRIITKEGEGRMAFAALLWSDGQRNEAEKVLGDACVRLDQLQAQIDAAVKKSSGSSTNVQPAATLPRLLYSIDDDERGVGNSMSCSKFKNPQFIGKLAWPESLQKKVTLLQTLR